MLTQKEFLRIFVVWIILSFMVSFIDVFRFLKTLAAFAIILTVFIGAKKLVAYYYEAEEEEKIWYWDRYWFSKKARLKHPIPLGIILTLITPFLTLGSIIWLATTRTEVKPKNSRAVKRHGFYSYSELTEWHLALISAAGILSLLVLAPIAYIFNWSLLVRLSIYFAAYNVLPLSKLDGTKIFFGSRILYLITLALTAISLFYAFLL